MLITSMAKIKWGTLNKKRYESKGYIFTKIGDEFDCKVEDLLDGSTALVNVSCDCENCITPINKPIKWCDYKKHVHKNGKYYCQRCSMKLYGTENYKKSKLKNGKSFYDWCLEHNRFDILLRWDFELNMCSPSNISYTSKGLNKKGYWFKCLKNPKHKSELKNINNFIRGHDGTMDCKQCNII